MVREKLKALALRREIQVLVVFGLVAGVGYYMYLQNKKKRSETNLPNPA